MRGAETHEVRPAQPNDLDAVVAIEQEAFSDAWSRRSFAELVGRPEVRFSVVLREHEVVGYAVAFVAADEAELMNLAIATGARGLGIGSRLLFSVLGEARDAGADWIWLEVRGSNAAARALYDRSGFTEVGIRKHYYDQPVEDAIVMRRQTAVQ